MATPASSGRGRQKTLSNLTPLMPVNIDFTDLNFTVYQNEYGEFWWLIDFCGHLRKICMFILGLGLHAHALGLSASSLTQFISSM